MLLRKQCEEWYMAYKNMDFSKINSLSEELSENTEVLKRYVGCRRENSIIQNMTAMVNNKKDMRFCVSFLFVKIFCKNPVCL